MQAIAQGAEARRINIVDPSDRLLRIHAAQLAVTHEQGNDAKAIAALIGELARSVRIKVGLLEELGRCLSFEAAVVSRRANAVVDPQAQRTDSGDTEADRPCESGRAQRSPRHTTRNRKTQARAEVVALAKTIQAVRARDGGTEDVNESASHLQARD